MTVCGRGCCWNPWGCSLAYDCRCHWEGCKPAKEPGDGYTHRDPTSYQAIKNVMRERKKHK